jgi:Putative F0F1-ATPase subunit Ca2+/Mg2+ transporter
LEKPKNSINNYAKYSGLAFQMGLVIFLAAYAGQKLDAYFALATPWCTVVLSLLAIFGVLYSTIQQLSNDK